MWNGHETTLHAWSSYLTPSPDMRGLGVLCLGTGAQDGAVPAVVHRTMDVYGAVFVDRGHGWHEAAGQRTPVGPGTLIWLLPGLTHTYGPDADGWSEHWALFDGPATNVYARLGLFDRTSPTLTLSDSNAMLRLFAHMRRVVGDAGPVRDIALSGLVHQLIVTVQQVRDAAPIEHAAHVVAALRRQATSAMSIAEHARTLGISVRELRELVHRATGESPKRFIIETRLNQAKSLLVDDDLPVSRVAAHVGYDDPAYFTRLFTREVGISPARFREQYLRGPASALPAQGLVGKVNGAAE